jgi:hypothetical protein
MSRQDKFINGVPVAELKDKYGEPIKPLRAAGPVRRAELLPLLGGPSDPRHQGAFGVGTSGTRAKSSPFKS